jgi:predicted methyltransferase
LRPDIRGYLVALAAIFILTQCKDPAVEKKIDAHLRMKMMTLKQSAQAEATVAVVFKASETLTESHKMVLQKKGIHVTAGIGNIYSATLPANKIYDLAKMRFVESIQGSKEFQIPLTDSTRTIQKL